MSDERPAIATMDFRRGCVKELPPFRTGTARIEKGLVRPVEGVEIPFSIVEGAKPGPCVLVTAGVHGSEYCSIETAVRLMQLGPQEIKGTLVVLPILNVQGFRKRSIYLMPEDGKNLNRMFPGRPDGTVSERLAHWLVTRVFPEADAYLDLHGGDLDESLMPFTIFPRDCQKSRELAAVFGLPIAVAAPPGGNSINGAHGVGVPCILPELSGNGLWDEGTVEMMLAGVRRVMAHLGMLAAPKPSLHAAAPKFVTMWVPQAPVDGLWYPSKELGEKVRAGEVLGEIRDVFGEVLATVRSEKDGFILYRLTSLAVNAKEALLGVGTRL